MTNRSHNFNSNYAEDLLKLYLIPKSEYLGNSKNIEVKCLNCDREFTSTLGKLKSGVRVCICVREQQNKEKRVKDLLDIQNFALSKNGECLAREIKNRSEKILWGCENKHTWMQSPTVVMGKLDTWCPYCAGNSPRTLEELKVVVKKRKGKLLSSEYINSDAKYDFECMLGHKFSNRFRKVIDRGQWCPQCNKGHISEEIARTTFEQIFREKFPKSKPSWLKNRNGRQLEFDGYCKKLNIAFEYQGIQHFDKRRHLYPGSLSKDQVNEKFRRSQENDKDKEELARKYNVRLFVLSYKDAYIDFPNLIFQQAKKFNLNINLFDFQREINFDYAYLRNDRLSELKNLLIQKNIEVSSKNWLGANAKYELHCLTCNYRWKARGNAFFNSRRVAGCKKCAMKELAASQKGSIQDLLDYAQLFNGGILSNQYLGRNHKYTWKCENDHIFIRNLNTMKWYKNFCPECDGLQSRHSKSEREQQLLENNFTPLSDYPGPRQDWKVKCLKCKKTLKRRMISVESKNFPCENCRYLEMSKEAKTLYTQKNLKPLVNFPGRYKPWKSKCMTCLSTVSPALVNLQRGQGGCKPCSRKKRQKST